MIALILAIFAGVVMKSRQWAVFLSIACIPLFLLRFSVLGVPTTVLEIMLYILAAGTLIYDWKKLPKPNSCIIITHGALLIAAGIGIAISHEKHVALGFVKGFLIDPIILLWLIKTHIKNEFDKRKLFYAFIISAVGVGIASLVNMSMLDGRVTGIFGSANYLSMYLEPAIMMCVGLFLTMRKRWWIWVLIGSFLSIIMLLARSYAGWLGLFIGVCLAITLSKWRWKKMAVTGLITLAAVGITSQWHTPKLQNILNPDKESSISSREEIYHVTWELIKENPLFGVGPGQFDGDGSTGNVNFWDGNAHVILGKPPQDTEVLHSHNLFLTTYTSFGLLGFAALMNILYLFFKNLRPQKNKQDFIALCVMLTILIHGLFDTTIWKNDLSVIFWLILAIPTYHYAAKEDPTQSV